MMDVTSGEMYFRIKNAAGFSSELATFNAFLRTDIDANHQKSEMFAQLKNIRSSRMHMRKDMVSKMMIANHIRHMIDTKRFVESQLINSYTDLYVCKTPPSIES